MCIGIPMKVLSIPSEGRAVCQGRGLTENLDTLLFSDLAVGDWVLAWNGMATQILTEDRARQIDSALDAVEAAMNGQEAPVSDPFADITANTGKLPPHLRKQVRS